MAPTLLHTDNMLVETVFQYRTLTGKCDLGLGLSWDEIERLGELEAQFAPSADDRRMTVGRKHRREPTKLSALMRGDRIHDRVDIVEIGPGGLVCRQSPYVARGEIVEIVLEIGDVTYRFSATGVWLKDDGDDYRIGLAFVGMPVACHNVALAEHATDVVDRIAA